MRLLHPVLRTPSKNDWRVCSAGAPPPMLLRSRHRRLCRRTDAGKSCLGRDVSSVKPPSWQTSEAAAAGLQEMTGALSPRRTSRLAAAHRWLPQCQLWRGGAIAAKRSCWVSNSVGAGVRSVLPCITGIQSAHSLPQRAPRIRARPPPLFVHSHFLVGTSVCRFGLLSASPGHGRARQCC